MMGKRRNKESRQAKALEKKTGAKVWKSRSAAGEVPRWYGTKPGQTFDGRTLNELSRELQGDDTTQAGS